MKLGLLFVMQDIDTVGQNGMHLGEREILCQGGELLPDGRSQGPWPVGLGRGRHGIPVQVCHQEPWWLWGAVRGFTTCMCDRARVSDMLQL
jgi:hypothetical protein